MKDTFHIEEHLLTTTKNRPYLRDESKVIKELRGIVIHWTANTNEGAGAIAHRNYFNNVQDRWASVHYGVDDEHIMQYIPDHELAYHVGDNPRHVGLDLRKKVLKDDAYGYSPNRYLIGIEMCVNVDSDWQVTVEKTAQLVGHLLSKYPHLTLDDVYRHYDITGKNCPIMFLPYVIGRTKYEWNWPVFKSLVSAVLNNDN